MLLSAAAVRGLGAPSTPKSRAALQLPKQLGVGGGKSELIEFLLSNPGESLAPQRLGFVFLPETTKEFEVHGFPWVTVRNGVETFGRANFNPQLLPQFATQAFLERFLRLPFASGKFPKSTQMIVRAALRDEEFA